MQYAKVPASMCKVVVFEWQSDLSEYLDIKRLRRHLFLLFLSPKMLIHKRIKKENKMFIQTEMTPNPNTLKFLPGKLSRGQSINFKSKRSLMMSPLVERCLSWTVLLQSFWETLYLSQN